MEKDLLDQVKGNVLYRKLADVLRQQISEGSLSVGTRLPTEYSLSKNYGVSRGTVRQALQLLEKDGLIERIPGVGTFINRQTAAEAAAEALAKALAEAQVEALAKAQDGHQAKREGSQRQIGLIVPAADDQLSLDILVGVESVAKYRGFQVVFNRAHESLEEEKAAIARMRKDGVAGIILFPVSNEVYNEAIWELHEEKFPFVLVDRYFPDLDCDTVAVDNVYGGYRATEHLILTGHQVIGFMFHPQADFRTTSVRDRYQGYRKALDDYHIAFQEDWLVSIEEPQNLTRNDDSLLPYLDYLRMEKWPRAFFTVNDTTAISLLAAAGRLGIKIPDDLAVVGFDNLKIATQIEHPLTTINQERIELGARAAQLLLRRIDGHTGRPEHIMIPTSLIIRETCGARQKILKSRLEE